MSCSEKPNSSWLLTCPVTGAPTPEGRSAVARPPVWTVRITVGDTEVVYRGFRSEDAAGAIRQAAELALSRDMSECRDQLTMFLPRMAKGKTKEAQK